ncbi:unnamed protein product [Ceutorhynchus assimilis]|uniref:CMP/dCMP-type deaminase domain-containing protein n=1 Tax=Ceutorhynchus assimilis TaxID=467358 RepID=A0A9N9QNA6_9CUCU|nr:unnamed protein product [Ceutorhynchus assimilis]
MSCAKKIKLDEKILPILADDLLEDTPLVEVFVDSIKDQKTISKVVKDLNASCPIPELTHLKRIKAKEILLLIKNNLEKQQVHEYLKSNGFNVSLLCNQIRIVSVAKIAPKTKTQHAKVNQLWPCNFHSDKYIEKLSTNTLFDHSEILEHQLYMKVAIEVARYSKQNKIAHFSKGVVIVDPKIKSIVALGYSVTHENPCKHAPMIAIDNVAKTQNGGAWNNYEQLTTTKLNLCGIHPKLYTLLQEKFPQITFGASRFKGKSIKEPSDGPYLCTGYCVYSTHEPCIMCAMALVHSRVKRVFYGVKTNNGGLGTLCKVHTVKDLNHHYEVFTKLCQDECESLKDV